MESMGWNVQVLGALAAGLVAGASIVFWLMRRAGSTDRERAEQLSAELDETRVELESHREEVARHFGQTANLFRDLTERYTRLYSHLADGAREFCPDEVPSLAQGLEVTLLGGSEPEARDAAAAAPEQAGTHAGEEDPDEDLAELRADPPHLSKANGGRHPTAA